MVINRNEIEIVVKCFQHSWVIPCGGFSGENALIYFERLGPVVQSHLDFDGQHNNFETHDKLPQECYDSILSVDCKGFVDISRRTPYRHVVLAKNVSYEPIFWKCPRGFPHHYLPPPNRSS